MFKLIYEALRSLLQRLGVVKGDISDISADFPDYSGFYSAYISEWKRIYAGNPKWKRITYNQLGEEKTRDMQLLNAGKAACAELVAVTFSEQVEITIDNEEINEIKNELLEQNGFWSKFPEWLETAYALGGGALKCYISGGRPTVDYIHADHFVPSAWNNRRITGAAFVSHARRGDYHYSLVEVHSFFGRSDSVENALYKSKDINELGIQVDVGELYPGMQSHLAYNDIDHPMFCYFKPAYANNIDVDVPLGVSIFANATDTLKALDVAFDSFTREFVLGKKRIIVPIKSLRSVVNNETGQLERYFDVNDEAYVAFASDDVSKMQIVDNTVTLRIEEHVSAINALLNILCMQIGLSAGTLSFDAASGGVKTATEVISADSKTHRTKASQQNILVELIEDLVTNLITLHYKSKGMEPPQFCVTVGFKDDVVIDDNTLIDNNIKMVSAGLKSKIAAIMEVQKCDEKTAQQELDRIAKEQSVTGLSVDDLMGGGEGDEN